MIRIWHDSALRWMPLWLTITMLNSSVLLGLILWRRAAGLRDLQPPASWLLIILWLAIAFYIVFGHVRTRCQRFEMTLPIRAELLWRRHLMAVFVAGGLVLAGSLGVLVLHATLMNRVDGQNLLVIPYSALIGPLLAGLLLAAALVTSVQPGLQKLRGRTTYWTLIIGALVGIPLLLLLLIRWPMVSTALCLSLAMVVSWNTRRSLPAAFRLVPMALAPATTTYRTTDVPNHVVRPRHVYQILFGILHQAPPWKQFTPWMVYGFSALMGFILAGGVDRWMEVPAIRFLYLPFGSYMLFAALGVLTYNLYRLDALPVSRRTILAVLMVPGLIAYLAGYSLGWWARTTAPNPTPLVDFHVRQAHFEIDLHEGPEAKPRELSTMVWVEVDPSFMGVTFSGEPPMLTAPWGETHLAWSEKLYRGSSILMYSPYSTAEESTADFEALMLSRAIKDVYGKAIPPLELQKRYFVVENDQVVGLTSYMRVGPGYGVQRLSRGIPLLDDYPELEAPAGGPETPVYMAIVLIPWLLLSALFLRSFKATHSARFIRGVYWAGLAILILGLLSQVFLSVFGLFSPEAARGILNVFIRSLGTGPVAWPLTWVVAIVASSACYRLALHQFERAEIPTSPINCSLVDWGKEE